eukprot:scaffold12574_cov27-Prasinocladus_malaysianus.AAC.1
MGMGPYFQGLGASGRGTEGNHNASAHSSWHVSLTLSRGPTTYIVLKPAHGAGALRPRSSSWRE